MKIYTKTGDDGQTALLSGARVNKDDHRLEAYGTVDELNSVLGLVVSHLSILKSQANLEQYCTEVSGWLEKTQHQLFSIGSHLACDNEKMRSRLPALNESSIQEMEQIIDQCETSLPALKNFILPGGSRTSALLHLARSVCRRAERNTVASHQIEAIDPLIIKTLNRLSDMLFVLARYANFREGHPDKLWEK